MTVDRKPLRRTVQKQGATRAVVLHPEHEARDRTSSRNAASRLEEAKALAKAITLDVVHADIVTQRSTRPATFFGSGKVEEIGTLADALDAELVIVNAALTPVQQRNLERAWKTKVIDRTGLILEIFGERARTREGRLQVELANLTYQRSRLVRSWTHLERQRGGTGFLGGPGETQIEADRRVLAERITRLKVELKAVARTRGLQRRARKRVPYAVVALIGYTNAGKSTLFNALTKAEVYVEDLLFATLDPTMRALSLPGGLVAILSDTVGFISDLPTDLVAAFRATLEEVQEAQLILHVRDISHPETEDQRRDVHAVLDSLGLAEPERHTRIIEVWNKIDRLEAAAAAAMKARAERSEGAVAVSALTGAGLEALKSAVAQRLTLGRETVDLVLAPDQGALVAWLYRRGTVLARETNADGSVHLRARLSAEDLSRLDERLKEVGRS